MKQILEVILFSITGRLVLAGVLECSSHEDCRVPDAVCKDNLCACPFGHTFSTDGSKCLPYVTEYGGICDDDTQCAWLLGKNICNKGICVCDDGWRWYKGECIIAKKINEICKQDVDCYNGYDIFAMMCENNKCDCNIGYYLRGDYDCRPISENIGDECILNSDCLPEKAVCVDRKCVIQENYEILNIKRLNLEDKIIKVSNLSKISRILDTNCSDDANCQSVTNSTCSPLTRKCICKRGFFKKDDVCIPELGINIGCETDSDCKIRPGSCNTTDGACYCPKFRFNDKANRKCIKSMEQTDWGCITDEWCYALGTNSYCGSDQKCTCSYNSELDENFVCVGQNGSSWIPDDVCPGEIECRKPNTHCVAEKCWPNLGATCKDTCNIVNSVCDGICSCEKNYVANGTHHCVPVVNKLGDKCLVNEQCSEKIQNSNCIDNICACDEEEFITKNDTCMQKKYHGSYCTNGLECNVMMSNAICRNSKCECPVGTQLSSDGKKCVYVNNNMASTTITSFYLVFSFVNIIALVFH